MTTTHDQLLNRMEWAGRQARAVRRLQDFRQQIICMRDGDLIVAGFEFPGSGDTDAAGDVWRLFMALLIQSASADAAVFSSDTWIVRDDAAKDSLERDIRPKDHPDRQDAIAVVGVDRDGFFAQATWTYKIRPDGTGDFHDGSVMRVNNDDTDLGDSADLGGRMIDALRLGFQMNEPRDPDTVERIREMLVLGHSIGIEIVVHEEVWAAKYGAGLEMVMVPAPTSDEQRAWEEADEDE